MKKEIVWHGVTTSTESHLLQGPVNIWYIPRCAKWVAVSKRVYLRLWTWWLVPTWWLDEETISSSAQLESLLCLGALTLRGMVFWEHLVNVDPNNQQKWNHLGWSIFHSVRVVSLWILSSAVIQTITKEERYLFFNLSQAQSFSNWCIRIDGPNPKGFWHRSQGLPLQLSLPFLHQVISFYCCLLGLKLLPQGVNVGAIQLF